MAKTGSISLKTAHIKLKVDKYFLSQASLVFNSEKCGRHPWPDAGGGSGVTPSDATLGPPSGARSTLARAGVVSIRGGVLQVQVGAALPHEPRLAWLNFLLILLACSGGRGAESAAYGCSLQEGRRRRAAAAGWGRSGSLRCSTVCESQARRPEPGSLRTPSPCVSVCVCLF